MGLLSWVVLGLIAGALAKWVMPGKDPGGLVITTLLGIGGAFVGGFLGSFVGMGGVDSFSFGSIFTAMIGALALLYLHRLLHK